MARLGYPYEQLFPHLFSPMPVGNSVFKNRIFVAPTHTGFSAGLNNLMSPEGMEHYGSFAKGGAACVHIGETLLDRKNSAAHDSHINVIDEIVSKYSTDTMSTAIFSAPCRSIEFNHSGHFAIPQQGDGSQPMSASAMTMPSGVEVREMNEDDMEYVAYIYAKAANMVKRAVLTGLVALRTWLADGRFPFPILNRRKDKYGGSVENRMRFRGWLEKRYGRRGKGFAVGSPPLRGRLPGRRYPDRTCH